MERILREIWFRDPDDWDSEPPCLLNMDFEEIGSGTTWHHPVWAWEGHPWLALLGITGDECDAFFDKRNKEYVRRMANLRRRQTRERKKLS